MVQLHMAGLDALVATNAYSKMYWKYTMNVKILKLKYGINAANPKMQIKILPIHRSKNTHVHMFKSIVKSIAVPG
jgi:hypothetical protein